MEDKIQTENILIEFFKTGLVQNEKTTKTHIANKNFTQEKK